MERENFDISLLNMREIDETVELYTTTLKNRAKEYEKMFGCNPKNKNDIISRTIKNAVKDNERLEKFILILKELINEKLVTDDTILFYECLITNEKLRNKIRFISDGSYYKYRIWGNCLNGEKLSLDVDYEENKTISDMVEECQYIFLQIPYAMTENLESAKQWIEWEKEKRQCFY